MREQPYKRRGAYDKTVCKCMRHKKKSPTSSPLALKSVSRLAARFAKRQVQKASRCAAMGGIAMAASGPVNRTGGWSGRHSCNIHPRRVMYSMGSPPLFRSVKPFPLISAAMLRTIRPIPAQRDPGNSWGHDTGSPKRWRLLFSPCLYIMPSNHRPVNACLDAKTTALRDARRCNNVNA